MKKYLVMVGVLLLLLGGLPIVVGADTPAPGGPFNTVLGVQNVGDGPAHCMVEFYDSGGGLAGSASLPQIPVAESAFLYVPDVVGLADGRYAAVISCDQDVAAVASFGDADSDASYSGVGAGEISDTLYAPFLYDNYYSFYSNVVVQNVSGGLNDITLDIYEAGNPSPVYSNTQSNVPANGYVTFEQEGLAELNDNYYYAGVISGTGDMAAIVNGYGSGPTEDQLGSFTAFASGTSTAYAPAIANYYYDYNTALVIQNMDDTTTANVTITYATGVVKNVTIPPGAVDSRYTPNEGLAVGTLTSAKIECTNGLDIAVLVNGSTDYNRAATYSGFAGGTTTVRIPVVVVDHDRYNTSVTCMNVGTGTATMTIEYGGVAGATTSNPIDPDGIALFYLPDDPLLAGYTDWASSATVTSAEPISCVVNRDQNMVPESITSMDKLMSYNGFGQ